MSKVTEVALATRILPAGSPSRLNSPPVTRSVVEQAANGGVATRAATSLRIFPPKYAAADATAPAAADTTLLSEAIKLLRQR